MRSLLLFAIACSSAAADSKAVSIANGKPGEFTVTASAAVELDTMADIEVLHGTDWTVISDHFDLDGGYLLVSSCEAKKAPCTKLAAGASISPVPWTGMSCSSQCNHSCKKNGRLPEGDYRLVVTTCDHKVQFPGPAFRLPKS